MTEESKEEKKEPEFVCGIIVLLNKNGEGVRMAPITTNVERQMTENELIMVLAYLQSYHQAMLTSGFTVKGFEKRMEERMVNDEVINKLGRKNLVQ